MKKAIFIIIGVSILMFACAGNKNTVSKSDAQFDGGEGRPAPLELYINKASGAVPITIQPTNRTKKLLTYMEIELTLIDTLDGFQCKTDVMLIGPKYQDVGDSRRTNMYPNSTDLFNIDEIELKGADCWEQIKANWEHVVIGGKIKKTELID